MTLILAVTAVAANKTFTLVIDAGHGGHDAGALGKLTKEKHINLNVALAFGRKVEANCPDVKVVYTRKTDVFVPLHTRADIANRAKADLFVSIHTNAVKKGIVRGMETYTLGMHRAADNLEVAKRENEVILYEKDYKQRYEGFDPTSSESYIMFEFIQDKYMAQSVDLAKYVQRRTCASAGRTNKGVKQAGFLVLRETSMPSCLIELGFISTPDEERFLHSSSGVEQLAQGIYQAFIDYKKQYHQGAAQPLKVEVPAETAGSVQQGKDVKSQQDNPEEPKKEKKSKRKKSKMAQQLEAAREGQLIVQTVSSEPSADSIINAAPKLQASRAMKQPVDTVKRQEVAQRQEPVQKPEPVKKPEPAPKPVVAQQQAPAPKPVVAQQQAPAPKPVVAQQQKPAPKPVVAQQQEPAPKPVVVQQQEPAPKPVVAQKQEPAPKPVVAQQQTPAQKPVVAQEQTPVASQEAPADAPVFKVQIMASRYLLKPNDAQFKGVKGVEVYQENGQYKYTVGSSEDYSQIYQLRKTIVDRFPQAFIVSFKNGQKYDLQAAMREYRSWKK